VARLKIAIDAEILNSGDLPELLHYYYLNIISSLARAGSEYDFCLCLGKQSSSYQIRSVCAQANISFLADSIEIATDVNIYLLLDQLSLLKYRAPPMLFVPKTAPLFLIVHNLLAITKSEAFLTTWPKEVIGSFLYALEMIAASPAFILSSSNLEARIASSFLRVPKQHIASLPLAPSIPKSYYFNHKSWDQIQSKVRISGPFLLVPADLISESGLNNTAAFILELNKKFPDLQYVISKAAVYAGLISPVLDPRWATLPGVVIAPNLDYPEWLEMLARSSGYLLLGERLTSLGVAEAQALGVPVFCAALEHSQELKIGSAQDLYNLLNLKSQNEIESKTQLSQENLQKSWDKLGSETLDRIIIQSKAMCPYLFPSNKASSVKS
jgi:hypothetical protein